jgi:hypothetical protein
MLHRQNRTGKPGIWACDDHNDRIKCAVDGCSRTRKRTGQGYQEWLCPVHWKRHCPPRSLRRRCYHRFFRDAKRHGWTEQRAAQFWRFWDTLCRLANQAAASNAFDTTEINKLFGWNE